jgi:putative tricarboxylic transport membrane protein
MLGKWLAITGGSISIVFASACGAQATAWKPSAPVEFIAVAAAGGTTDLTFRTMQKIVTEMKLVPVTVNVVNKPGGGSAVAFNYLNQHPANGHYLSLSTPNLMTNQITGSNPVTYTDVTPVVQLYSEYVTFVVRADSPLKSGRDMIDRLKKDPGALSISLATGRGGANHIAAGLVAKAAGIDPRKLKIVVFDAAGKVVTALLGGHVDVIAASAASVVPQLQAGTVRVIAVSSPQRMDGLFATGSTWKEQGLNVELANWRGIIGPKGMGAAEVAYWEDVFSKMIQSAEWKRDVERNFATTTYLNNRDTRRFMDAQYAELKGILAELGLAK